jgi:hypothetical protein
MVGRSYQTVPRTRDDGIAPAPAKGYAEPPHRT